MNILNLFNRKPDKIQELSSDGEKIFIACLPKSASTFLVKTVQELTQFDFVIYTYGKGRNEQELYLPLLEKYRNINTVTHQHLRATEANLNLLKQFNIKPIVLVRNIFDSIISLREHFLNENEKWPMAYLTTEFKNLTESRQYDFIIDFVVPWYFNFYTSWVMAEKKGLIEIRWLSYEQIREDEKCAIEGVLKFHGIKYNGSIENAVARNRTPKNRFVYGLSGRGRESLTEIQIQKVYGFSQYYKELDFTRIGL